MIAAGHSIILCQNTSLFFIAQSPYMLRVITYVIVSARILL